MVFIVGDSLGEAMIDFLCVWAEPTLSNFWGFRQGRSESDSLSDHCISPTASDIVWSPSKARWLTVYCWGRDANPLTADARLSAGAGLSIFNGWASSRLGHAPVRGADEAAKTLDADSCGEFALLRLDHQGNGDLLRNQLASVQLYKFEQDNRIIIGTRPSLISAYIGHKRLSSDFARWVANYSVPMTAHSVFDGITCIAPGTKITFTNGRPNFKSPPGNILANAELARAYSVDRRAYWDRTYDALVALMRVVELTDLPIEFPISGGKDSRLLLGLLIAGGYRERIAGTFTNGPEFSPEVISGKAVATHLGLPHTNRWNGTNQRQSVDNIADKLLRHLFISEGEVSPIDLMSSMNRTDKFNLSGQESGLRNISGTRDVSTRDAVAKWLNIHLGSGDFCRIMTADAIQKSRGEIEQYITAAEDCGTPYDQIPTKHRVDNRGSRWVSRIWGANNSIGFSPHIFRTEVVTLAAYNAGSKSRSLQEFHFEMMRRVDPALVSIPFAGQTWDQELLDAADHAPRAPEPLAWPEGFSVFSQRGMFGAMKDHFPEFISFINRNASDQLAAVIDLDRLSALTVDGIKSGHVQPLWQVFQCALFDAVGDFGDLRTASGADFGVPEFA